MTKLGLSQENAILELLKIKPLNINEIHEMMPKIKHSSIRSRLSELKYANKIEFDEVTKKYHII